MNVFRGQRPLPHLLGQGPLPKCSTFAIVGYLPSSNRGFCTVRAVPFHNKVFAIMDPFSPIPPPYTSFPANPSRLHAFSHFHPLAALDET